MDFFDLSIDLWNFPIDFHRFPLFIAIFPLISQPARLARGAPVALPAQRRLALGELSNGSFGTAPPPLRPGRWTQDMVPIGALNDLRR